MPAFTTYDSFSKLSGLLILLLCQITYAWEQHPEAGSLTYTAYTSENHGGGAISCDIQEDPYGNLYIANEAGLLKFDGEHWSQMPATGQASYISSIAIDTKDRIWISGLKSIGYYSTDSRGNYTFNDLTDSISVLPQSSDFGVFWKLYAHDQYIYLITSKHVLRWDGASWRTWDFQEQRRILPSWIDDKLYIYARGTGLFYLNGDEFETVIQETPQIESGIISIIDMTENGLLCASRDNGLFYIKDGEIEQLPINFENPKVIVTRKLSNGTIAIGTEDKGVLIMNQSGQFVSHINHNSSFIYHIEESHDGTIWVTSMDAILQIPDITLTSYSDSAHDIVRHQQDLYYTNISELKIIDSQAAGALPTSRTLKQKVSAVWDLHSTGTDLLYGDSHSFGVIPSNGNDLLVTHLRQVMYLYPSWKDTTIIYSNDTPNISRWKNDSSGWKYLDSLPGFETGALSCIELPNSKLLISEENSPLSIADWSSPETIISLGRAHGLPDKFIWAQCLRIDECVIVISDKGLFHYDNDTETFHHDPALGNDLGTDAYGLESCPAAGNDGWILRLPSVEQNHNQVGHLSVAENHRFAWTPLQLPSLHLAGKVEALLHEKTDSSEILWVGGSKDLLRYDLSNMPDHPAPATRLTAIREQESKQTYYNGAGSSPDNLEWEYPQKTLRIEYATLPAPIIVQCYQTRLMGFNESWAEPSKLTFRDFTNLSHGDYTFEARTVDEFGRIGESASLRFTILPPWQSTVYAKVFYGAAASFALFIVGRLRSRKLRIRNEQLNALIHERTVELEQQKLQLIKANRAKQNFLASMSHEIRNPLNGILGITRILKEKEQQQGQSSEQITHLHTCSTHLHQLLGQTLDYSSLDAGMLRTRTESFDPLTVLDEVIQIQNDMAQTKGIKLTLKKPALTFRWKGDPVFLRQILINLVSNGIKYTPTGSVSLNLNYQKVEDHIQACFEVLDTGPGIPTDKQAFIFEEFTRLPDSEASQIPGTGLGLAISSQMAQLMGGRLELDGDTPNGARFLLYLEFGVDLYAPRKKRAEAPDNQQMLEGKRVLIADDMDFNRYVSTVVLRSMGAEIDQAENGLVALDMLRSVTYDIAILDINMPKMSGPEAVEVFLQDHNGPSPTFIALSAYTTPQTEEKCIAAGFNHFIEKPLEPEKLKKLLQRHQIQTESPPEQSLLSYLSKNSTKPLEALHAEYRKSFKQELANLQLTLINDDTNEQRDVIHKLLGLASINRTPKISELMEALLAWSKQQASNEEIAPLIEQLNTQIDQEMSR